MNVMDTQPLFAWAALEDAPSLGTIRRCLEAIPDGPLRQGLSMARGRGAMTILYRCSGASRC